MISLVGAGDEGEKREKKTEYQISGEPASIKSIILVFSGTGPRARVHGVTEPACACVGIYDAQCFSFSSCTSPTLPHSGCDRCSPGETPRRPSIHVSSLCLKSIPEKMFLKKETEDTGKKANTKSKIMAF